MTGGRRRRWSAVALVALVSAGLSATPASAASGDLDTTFSGDGKALLSRGTGEMAGEGVDAVVQSNGRVVLVGYANAPLPTVTVARLMPDGRVDTTFGTNGSVVLDIGDAGVVRDVLLQGDRIVLVGLTAVTYPSSATDIFVARLTPDGRRDTTFGTRGVVTLDLAGTDDGTSVVAGPNGSLFVGGSAQFDVAVAKLTSTGARASGFGTAGVLRIPTAQTVSGSLEPSLARLGGGVVVSFTDVGFAPTPVTRLVKVTGTGTIDATFGGPTGVVEDVTAGDEDASGVVVTGGRIISVTALVDDAWLIARSSDGSIDTSWASSGRRLVTLAGTASVINEVMVDTAGRIVLAGRSSAGGSGRWMAARVGASGTQDMAFGGDGTVDVTITDAAQGATGIAVRGAGYVLAGPIAAAMGSLALTATGAAAPTFGAAGVTRVPLMAPSVIQPKDVTIDPSGAILVGATTTIGNDRSESTLVRYRQNGTLDPGFGVGGVASTRVAGRSLGLDVVRRLSDGRYLTANWMSNDSRTWLVLARFTAAGQPDTTFGPGGRRVINGSGIIPSGSSFMVIDDAGRAVVAVESASKVVVVRVRPNGTLDPTFATAGVAEIGGTDPTVAGLRILPSGGIAVIDTGDLRVIRLLADGTLDASFGTGGSLALAVSTDFKHCYASMTSSGAVTLVDSHGTGMFTARVTAAGTLDATFGTAGIASLPDGVRSYQPRNLDVRSDGSVTVVGYALRPVAGLSTATMFLARYTPSGQLDTSFSGDGIALIDALPGGIDIGMAVSVRATRIAVAGYTLGLGIRLAVARVMV